MDLVFLVLRNQIDGDETWIFTIVAVFKSKGDSARAFVTQSIVNAKTRNNNFAIIA